MNCNCCNVLVVGSFLLLVVNLVVFGGVVWNWFGEVESKLVFS